ncbi:hypothetical protein HOR97_gp11 [Agrobacterium phage Atu_ph03]|uniref:dATP/dGTP diphosphohydrolase N-terminal domain-containing protein n=1 Tax=Agrobacterium phage Atu_ph03 TaxID=2024262 RepID=A0A223VZY4_9CAUD|nr:hypothetical protein HOR97_gp11 [Agrobacterium phage Atu_ph03]ASV44576.1 hypothetical protein [Agrobacterium phage Atu_ph03]
MTSGKDQSAKADGGKGDPTLLQRDFAPALYLVQRALDYGLIKYERGSWRKVEHERWDAAQRRHQQKLDMFEGKDDESDLPHRAHQIAGLIIMFQLEIEKAAKEMDKSVLDVATILGEFKHPPQDHKGIAPNLVHSLDAVMCNEIREAVEAAIPVKPGRRKRWINVRDAKIGDWVCANRNFMSTLGPPIVIHGKQYKVKRVSGDNVLFSDERGMLCWLGKSFFH